MPVIHRGTPDGSARSCTCPKHASAQRRYSTLVLETYGRVNAIDEGATARILAEVPARDEEDELLAIERAANAEREKVTSEVTILPVKTCLRCGIGLNRDVSKAHRSSPPTRRAYVVRDSPSLSIRLFRDRRFQNRTLPSLGGGAGRAGARLTGGGGGSLRRTTGVTGATS